MIKDLYDNIINEMVDNHLIAKKDKSYYSYELQVISEWFFMQFIILFTFHVLGKFILGVVFTLSFSAIRSSCGGFHCKTRKYCILLSLLTIATVILCERCLLTNERVFFVLVVIASLNLVRTGAINNPRIHWSSSELHYAKRRTQKVTLFMFFVFLILSYSLKCTIVGYYLGMGILHSSLSLLLEEGSELFEKVIS